MHNSNSKSSHEPGDGSELFETVKEVFHGEGWNYTEVEGSEVITCGFEANHTRVSLHVQVFSPLRAVSVVSESVLTTKDAAKRERLAEMVMRVNRSLTVGAFELDWDEGRVLFRAANLFSDSRGDSEIISGLVHNVIAETDRISPVEILIHRSEGPELAGIDIPAMLQREDLLPG